MLTPCHRTVYKRMNEPDRSTGYVVDRAAASDYSLTKAWYRSASVSGNDMPTEPVFTGQCNAYAPIYLIDELPRSRRMGIVNLTACASFLHEDCVRRYTIPVKKCRNFNVYCLSPVLDGLDRYCMGSERPCTDAEWSPTNYSPCYNCSQLILDYDTRSEFDLAVTQGENANQIKFVLLGSDKSLKINMEEENTAVMTLRLAGDVPAAFVVKQICLDTKNVKKMKIKFYDEEGNEIDSFSGKPNESCMWDTVVPDVQEIRMEFRKKSNRSFIKLKNMAMNTCLL